MKQETTILREFSLTKLTALNEALSQLAQKAVVVGVTAASNQTLASQPTVNQPVANVPMTLAGLLALHEFGSLDGRIPERPALRATFAANRREYVDFSRDQYRKVIRAEMTAVDALEHLGLRAASDVQQGIGARTLPLMANHPSTITQKGSDTPLVDTGQLRQSIRHEVREV